MAFLQIGAILISIISMCLFGISSFFAALNSRRTSSLNTVLFFFAINIIIMALLFALYGGAVHINYSTVLLLALAGVLGFLALWSFYKALSLGYVSIVSPVANGYGFIPVILSILLLHEILSTYRLLLILVIIAGTIVVALKRGKGTTKHLNQTKGIKYALMALIGWGFWGFLYSFLSLTIGWVQASFFTAISMTIVALMYVLLARIKIDFKRISIPITLANGVSGAFAVIFYGFAVSFGNVSIPSAITSTSPFLTVILGYLFLKERLGLSQTIGISAIIIGLVLLSL